MDVATLFSLIDIYLKQLFGKTILIIHTIHINIIIMG